MFVRFIACRNRSLFANCSTGYAKEQNYRKRGILCQNVQISPCLLGLVYVFFGQLYDFRTLMSTLALTMSFDIPDKISQSVGELTAKFPLSY
jgi:hypothetical protein